MTDTTTADGPDAPGSGPDVPADEPIALSAQIGTAEHKPIKDRLLLPLLVPILSAIAVGTLAVNVSRIFLAGSSDAALLVAIVLVLSILGGASLLAAAPRMKTSSLAVVTGLIVVVVVSGGLLTLGPSLGHGESAPACVAPTGAAASTVSVQAGPGLSFNGVKLTGNYTASPGVVEIDYGGDVGHTLAFRQPNVLCKELQSSGSPTTGKVLLKAGATYNIFCTIPGHAAQGMEATITVGAS
jgi:plastocyanin